MKIIIIGGVAGGATAASRIRRLNETAQITIYEKSGYISYANCGLPYYLGGVIKDKNQTGYPRNHNTGLVTDEYAHMFKGDRIGVATTSSQYGSEAAMTYLKTYRIFVTTFKI